MASPFPSSRDSLATNHAVNEVVQPAHVNDMASAVNAIEAAIAIEGIPAANKVPFAGASGILAPGWLGAGTATASSPPP